MLKDWDRGVVKRHIKSGKEGQCEALSEITAKFKLNVSEDTLLKELTKMGRKFRNANSL